MLNEQDCPCGAKDSKGRVKRLGECCGVYLNDFEHTPAPTAEHLMRSRYSAYVLEHAPYLLATWHASKRPSRVTFDAGAKWLGLEVRDHVQQDDTHAQIEFVARNRVQGRATRMHERSRFVREDGRWFYVDGDWL
jgi:SEC-C motif-containing protein